MCTSNNYKWISANKGVWKKVQNGKKWWRKRLAGERDLQHCHLSSTPHRISCLLLPHLYDLRASCVEKRPLTKGTKPFHSNKLLSHAGETIQEKLTILLFPSSFCTLYIPFLPLFSLFSAFVLVWVMWAHRLSNKWQSYGEITSSVSFGLQTWNYSRVSCYLRTIWAFVEVLVMSLFLWMCVSCEI